VRQPQQGEEVIITGVVSKQKRPDGQGFYFQLTTETGIELALSMTESRSHNDDIQVLKPLLGKKVAADGLIRKNAGELQAFTIKLVE
jgi:hypothetical protein